MASSGSPLVSGLWSRSDERNALGLGIAGPARTDRPYKGTRREPSRGLSVDAPVAIADRSFPNDDYLQDLALLEILGSDLRASLARDLLARESARDGDGLTP